ncbi:MAG: dUTP diphosphatase [Alphaproteobacteria bacterium]|nr:dUTP diphosphatase [Alphaproteobacteria bacterium]
MKIQKLSSKATIPVIGTTNSAGYDLVACIDNDIEIKPNEFILVPTGIAIEIPNGYFGVVCSRSGLACKYGIHVLNAPGIIDSDYRGEIKCILHNCSNDVFTVKNGTRIAQLIIMKHETVNWIETDGLSDTGRGKNGFGSTGMKV